MVRSCRQCLLSCALYYTDALDSNELSVSNILCLRPIDGPCLFQLKEFFYSFPFYIKIKILKLRNHGCTQPETRYRPLTFDLRTLSSSAIHAKLHVYCSLWQQ